MAEKKRKTVKVRALSKSAGKKAKDVKGGMLPGTDDKTNCCRTICTHRHCNN